MMISLSDNFHPDVLIAVDSPPLGSLQMFHAGNIRLWRAGPKHPFGATLAGDCVFTHGLLMVFAGKGPVFNPERLMAILYGFPSSPGIVAARGCGLLTAVTSLLTPGKIEWKI